MKLIKLTLNADLNVICFYNADHIVSFWCAPGDNFSKIETTSGTDEVKETPEQIAELLLQINVYGR